mgnify:CR=1 FL=1
MNIYLIYFLIIILNIIFFIIIKDKIKALKLSGILTETDFISEIEIISERSEHSSTVGTEGDKWSWDSTSVLYIDKRRL